jgi:outer membrane protein assembly factor BamB
LRRRPATALAAPIALCTAAALCGALLSACGTGPGSAAGHNATDHRHARSSGGRGRAPLPFRAPDGYGATAHLKPGPNLTPGSRPSVLPTDVLIADRNNNRLIVVDPRGNVVWQFPKPGDLAPGQTFRTPDDAFFTPNGRDIIVTQEDNYVISEISVATGRIVWRYGHPGVPGSGANHVDNPDDAMMAPNGDVVLADIKNCRLLVLRPPSHTPLEVIGQTTSACAHQPPTHWGSPNGVFPLSDGTWLVTEINGDWVDGFDLLTGKVLWSTNPPGVAYPSDTNQVHGDVFITVDYSNPGQVVEFTSSGQLVWRYEPTGAQALDQPSLAVPLSNGDVLLNDDWNHRVIVVDPRTDQVVWQYGHTGIPGAGPGYLDKPDGVDLVPPYSLTILHRNGMRAPQSAAPGGG